MGATSTSCPTNPQRSLVATWTVCGDPGRMCEELASRQEVTQVVRHVCAAVYRSEPAYSVP